MIKEESMNNKTTPLMTKGLVTLAALLLTALFANACAPEKKPKSVPDRGKLKIVYVDWSSEIASSHVVEAVLEKRLGYNVLLYSTTVKKMWQDIASGKADAMVAAWLPSTHAHYYEKVKDKVEDLGPNLKGTRTGLLVPDVTSKRQTADSGTRNESYIQVESIPELKGRADRFGGAIIGIDSGAGIMNSTRQAIKAYGLKGFELVEGSEKKMIERLGRAIQLKKPIVVTGWTPLWIHARWKLRYLKDPKNIYGGKESIHTIVRQGLKKDHPRAYKFLDNFHWTAEQMERVMVWNQNKGALPTETAERYIRTEKKQVNTWLP
jgi:glycine betaine/proline transport system substrate-binding protein